MAGGVAGLLGLLVVGAFLIVRLAAPPPRVEAFREAVDAARGADAASAPAVPPPVPDAAQPQDERMRYLSSLVQVEASVLAALREQVQQAQQELAALQQQKATARMAVDELQRQQDGARVAGAKPPFRPDPQRQTAQADPATSTFSQPTGDRVVTRQPANVRIAPVKDAAVQRTAPAGTVLQVFSRSRDGWVQVGDDAAWGWIYSSLLDPAR